jgi:hypothetical protein
MKRTLSLLIFSILLLGYQAVFADTKKIQDNSFLIEEAYNQEPGVIQHIQNFIYKNDGSWVYTFTQEWPVPGRTHQLSYMIPVLHIKNDGAETGLGDVMLNYRYQLVLKDAIAMAPRLSLLFPTGNSNKGLGKGAVGVQVLIPLSVELSEKWVTHWNIGTAITPQAKGLTSARANTYGYLFGASVIWLALEDFNFLLETLWTSAQNIEADGSRTRENSLLINPGFRCAANFKSGLQIVPGISAPIGVGPSKGNYGVFFYLSFEHPLF